jgi:hypothetical protein
MKRSMSDGSAQGEGFVGAAVRRTADWSFPLILTFAWMIALAYTLAILSGGASPVQPGKTVSSPGPIAGVHAIAARQPKAAG